MRSSTRVDDPAPGVVCGPSRVARRYGKSREWARTLLETWEREQKVGGPCRVFRHGKRGALCTTLAVLHAEMPPGRDMSLVRKVAQLERDLDQLTRRLDRETTWRVAIEKQLLRGRPAAAP